MKPTSRKAAPAMLAFLAIAAMSWASQSQDTSSTDEIIRRESREFRLSPGDVIEAKFFYNPELDDSLEIRPDGMISMPLIGELSVDGLTITETRLRLEELYKPILKQPSITVHVRNYAAQKIYVGGEVLRPGVIALKGELTLLDAIMETGGTKLTGSDSKVVLIRKDADGQAVRYELAMQPEDGTGPAGDVKLQPFDVVLVPETKIARVDRWVDQYIRQIIPITLSAGFTYLKSGGTVIIP